MPRKTWTADDEVRLERAAREGGKDAAYAAFPDRSAVSVHSKMQRMGLLPHGRGDWSGREDAVLLSGFSELGAAALAASGCLPGRSRAAIYNRAMYLGLHRHDFGPARRPASPEEGLGESRGVERNRLWTAREDRMVRAVMERMGDRPLRKYLTRAANLLDVSEAQLAAHMLELR